MRLISIEQLKEGDRLCTSVYAANGIRILTAGVPLSGFYIDKLKQLGIRFAYIEDDNFSDIIYKEPISFQTRNNAIKIYNTLLDDISKGREIKDDELKNISKAIVDDVKLAGIPVIIHNGLYPEEEETAVHAINTAILAVAIGVQVSLNFNQLCDLCLGAFLHDAGRGKSANDDNPMHPQTGFEALRKSGNLSLTATAVILQHHENFDGTGFPRKLKGSNISEFAKIVHLADYFNNITGGRRGTGMPYEKALEDIINNENRKFDIDIIKAFKNSIQVYFDGSMVVLSDGTQGIVQRQVKGKPLRPMVKLFSEIMPEYFEEIDLSTTINVRIVKRG